MKQKRIKWVVGILYCMSVYVSLSISEMDMIPYGWDIDARFSFLLCCILTYIVVRLYESP